MDVLLTVKANLVRDFFVAEFDRKLLDSALKFLSVQNKDDGDVKKRKKPVVPTGRPPSGYQVLVREHACECACVRVCVHACTHTCVQFPFYFRDLCGM